MSASNPVPSNVTLAPGVILDGKYRIDDVLGEGGMGLVWSATHLVLDAPVAIKVVREELASNEDIVSRLLFEARASARMRSKHIVRVLDVAQMDTGTPYIVMERLEGSDLGELIVTRGALPVPSALSYLQQVCEGLAEAHSLGIIHRDLKPENLFLATTPEGPVVKILDFGISKNVGTSITSNRRTSLTSAGSIAGSPSYMSPEQLRALPTVDARADIWALGAILYELLTEHCPFEAETPATLCVKVITEEAPSLLEFSADFPPALDSVIRRCLSKDPNARFQSVIELSSVLRDIADAAQQPARDIQAREGTDSSVDLVAPSSWVADPIDADDALPFKLKERRRSRSPSRQVFAAGALALLGITAAHPYSRHEAATWLSARLANTDTGVALAHPADAPRANAPSLDVRRELPAPTLPRPPAASVVAAVAPAQRDGQAKPVAWVNIPAHHPATAAPLPGVIPALPVLPSPGPLSPAEEAQLEELAAPTLAAIASTPLGPPGLPDAARAPDAKSSFASKPRAATGVDSRAAGVRYGL